MANDVLVELFVRGGKSYTHIVQFGSVVVVMFVQDENGITLSTTTIPTVSYNKDRDRWLNGVKNIFGEK
jgi:hypothetical protein